VIDVEEYHVLKCQEIGTFLKERKRNWKNLLKYGKVKVNGKKITNYHYLLNENDWIVIDTITKELPKEFEILYEDHEFIVVHKPYGLLSISTEKEKINTLYHKVRLYANKKKEKIFILHRLDQDTSGVIVFVKSKHLQELMQKRWNDIVKKRYYVAIVKGILDKKEDALIHYLKEEKNLVKVVSKHNGKYAQTNYKVLKEKNNLSLVDIDLKTGRKNQIRVQFSHIGHPIIGDCKYGVKDHRLYLHAYEFSFIHPLTGKVYDFQLPIPKDFERRMNL